MTTRMTAHNLLDMPGYHTGLGACVNGDTLDVLQSLDDESIDLVVTSPPFPLQRKKAYGNEEKSEYVEWLMQFGRLVYRKLSPTGSFVIDLGSTYEKGKPITSLYHYRVLLGFCDDIGFELAQPFYWHNTSALPAPIEWVNKRKLRAKTSVNTIWWLCKDPFCKANVSNVLIPYSDRMRKMMEKPEAFVKEENTKRPSGHVLGKSSWLRDNGGAIPPNMFQWSNTGSASRYQSRCKSLGIKPHPARFPLALPEFFIKMLTDPGDLVVDIFSGSNTTGEAAERLERHWLGIDLEREYVAASALRFVQDTDEAKSVNARIVAGQHVRISLPVARQLSLDL